MTDYSKMHEWELAHKFKVALEDEDYIACAAIKKEVTDRISKGTIDHDLMDGFKYYDSDQEEFVGKHDIR